VCAAAVVAGACRWTEGRGEAQATRSIGNSDASRTAVSLPDLSGADADAQRQIREAYAALRASDGAPVAERSAAYASVGKLLMAAELNDAAESYLLNALALTPDDWRWTYYLGHLYRRKGDLAASAEYFERAAVRRPDDVATLWWLGTVYLDLGRNAEAEALYGRALAARPGALSAVYGLGRAALARGDYAKAVQYFERVLAMNKQAVAAHYPLGLAYRGLGQMQQAEAHLAQRSHMEILPIDPLIDELDGLLHSVTAIEDRGMRAAQSGNWEEAARQFHEAVVLAPDNVDARLDLSTALARSGDTRGALAEAREAARLAPQDPRARSIVESLSKSTR
jgi:tetratricopeptide (TPR) repeat protein